MKLHNNGLAKVAALAALLTTSMTPMAFADNTESAEQLERAEREKQAAKTEVWKPVPAVVTAKKNAVPSDAIPLLANDLSAWESVKGGDANWQFVNGELTVKPGTGDIKTKQGFL